MYLIEAFDSATGSSFYLRWNNSPISEPCWKRTRSQYAAKFFTDYDSATAAADEVECQEGFESFTLRVREVHLVMEPLGEEENEC